MTADNHYKSSGVRGKKVHLSYRGAEKTFCGLPGPFTHLTDGSKPPPPPPTCKTCDRIAVRREGEYDVVFSAGMWCWQPKAWTRYATITHTGNTLTSWTYIANYSTTITSSNYYPQYPGWTTAA